MASPAPKTPAITKINAPPTSTPVSASNGNGSRTKLENALKIVVAAVHAATLYAKEIGYQMPAFTSEDIRSMADTLLINSARHG